MVPPARQRTVRLPPESVSRPRFGALPIWYFRPLFAFSLDLYTHAADGHAEVLRHPYSREALRSRYLAWWLYRVEESDRT